MENLFETCSNLKVDYIFLEPFSPGLNGRGNKNLNLSVSTSQNVQEFIRHYIESYSGQMTIIPFTPQTKWYTTDDIIYCGGMYTSFIVQSDGTIGVCEQASHPLLNFGNIKEQSLQGIWNSQEVIKFLNPDKSIIKDPCGSCESFNKCRSGCFNYSLQYSDDLYAPDPRCWKADLGEVNPLRLANNN